MGNPQINSLNNGMKATNSHVSGRFSGQNNINNNVNSEEHPSTLYSKVNTENQVVNKNVNHKTDDPLPKLTNNKFFSQNDRVNVENNQIIDNNNDIYAGKSKYMSDPNVIANLEKKDDNVVIDIKTLMILALIVMFFIFMLPFLYDILNGVN